MKKRYFAGLLVLFLWALSMGALLPMLSAHAADSLPRLVDKAGLLTDSEAAQLLDKLDEISERQRMDVVVVTEKSIGGSSAEAYADDFFDYNGYGYGEGRDGILLLVTMAEREWHMSTSGYGIVAFTDAGLEYMESRFLSYLSKGDYAKAFSVYAELCDDLITQADEGEPYDIDLAQADAGKPYDIDRFSEMVIGISDIAIAFVAAFVLSLIITGIMRLQLKSVRGRKEARDYIVAGSMQVTRQSDSFLYSRVDRRAKPKNSSSSSSHRGGSSTHRSSSGRSHGGRGGRF